MFYSEALRTNVHISGTGCFCYKKNTDQIMKYLIYYNNSTREWRYLSLAKQMEVSGPQSQTGCYVQKQSLAAATK